jgi:hypothetical protein
MRDRYVHRLNQDRTIDSICTLCFATVCREPTLLLAKECEDKHVCPGPLHSRTYAPSAEALWVLNDIAKSSN